MKQTKCRLDAATLRRLAVKASCDPRTLLRVLAGETVRGMAGERAREALADAGLLADVPVPGTEGARS